MKSIFISLIFLVTMTSLVTNGWSEMLDVPPSKVAVLSGSDGDGSAIVMQFDLSGILLRPGFQIVTANIDWHLSGVPEEKELFFSVHKVMSSWTPELASQQPAQVSYVQNYADEWTLNEMDFERVGTFVRLRVPELVHGWLENPESNQGVVIKLLNSLPLDLGAQIGKAHLVVRYIYEPQEGPVSSDQ